AYPPGAMGSGLLFLPGCPAFGGTALGGLVFGGDVFDGAGCGAGGTFAVVRFGPQPIITSARSKLKGTIIFEVLRGGRRRK
ncbi:MAG TPA: hypothetical protein VKR82_11880, partial [Candidatus Acidoferrales bacterium]|nr:hypothetical protein [Candidatus Acidoferrales bacterium]